MPLLLVITLCCLLEYCGAYTEIVNAEHLWDLLYSVERPALIAIGAVGKLPYRRDALPDDGVLFCGYYDPNRARQAWYPVEGVADFDLAAQFQATESPRIVFLRGYKSNPADAEFSVWDESVDLLEWVWSKLRAELVVENRLDEPIFVSFATETSGSKLVVSGREKIAPKSDFTFDSYRGHSAIITNGEAVYEALPLRLDRAFVVVDAACPANAPRIETELERLKLEAAEYLSSTLEKDWSHTRRHLLNLKQPPLMPAYTPSGFQKVRVPEEIFGEILSLYESGAARRRSRENWYPTATQLNFAQVETTMVHMSSSVIRRVAESLRRIHEAWIGGTELKFMQGYGVREYHRGARLFSHVDRIETHAVSSIINVAQEGMESDWELELIHTKTGEKHFVAMQPGDLVLYESCKLAHGRPAPLNGSLYANLFLHFRPADASLWPFSFTPNNEIVIGGDVETHVPLVGDVYTR